MFPLDIGKEILKQNLIFGAPNIYLLIIGFGLLHLILGGSIIGKFQNRTLNSQELGQLLFEPFYKIYQMKYFRKGDRVQFIKANTWTMVSSIDIRIDPPKGWKSEIADNVRLNDGFELSDLFILENWWRGKNNSPQSHPFERSELKFLRPLKKKC
jgi:hypothetical protein